MGQHYGLEVKIQGVTVVIGRQLAIDAIAQNLALHFVHEQRSAHPTPRPRSFQLRKENAGHEERGRFSDEVRVRAAVYRQIAVDVIQLFKQRPAYAPRGSIVQSLRWEEEEQRPQPGDRPDRNVEAGLPVDAHVSRVLFDPALHLGHRFARVSLLAGEEPGFRQPGQMLVSVQLENGLGIPGAAVVDRIVVGPEAPLPASSGDRIAVPVDLGAEIQRSVAQDFDSVFAKPLGLLHRPFDPAWRASGDQPSQILTIGLRRRQVETRRRALLKITREVDLLPLDPFGSGPFRAFRRKGEIHL